MDNHAQELSQPDRGLDAAAARHSAQIVQRLRSIALFNRFSDAELAVIEAIGKILVFKTSANAVVEGDPTRGMYLLLQGSVSVYKTDISTGSMVRLTVLQEGANFGELSLFDSAPRSATVVAESLCQMFFLGAEEFSAFLEKGGEGLQMRFFKSCAEDLAARFRVLNSDYLNSQRLLWKYALRRSTTERSDEVP